MIVKLSEDFSKEVPDYVKDALLKYKKDNPRILNTRVYDYANMVYHEGKVPSNPRKAREISKVPNRMHIFRLYPEAVRGDNPSVAIFDDHMFYSNPSIKDEEGYWRPFKSLKWDDKLKYVMSYGYIDSSYDDIKSLRKSRSLIKKDSDADKDSYLYRDKTKGKLGDEGSWVYEKGYDKSGYRLDPDRIAKKLYNINYDNYADKLKMYYRKIENLRDTVMKILDSTPFDDLRLIGITQSFSDILGLYRDMKSKLDSYLREIDQARTEEDKNIMIGILDQYLNSEWGNTTGSMRRFIMNLRSYIKDNFPEIEMI